MATEDFSAFIGQLQSVVTSPQGRQLVDYLRTRFMDRWTTVQEQTPTGQYALMLRESAFSSDPLEMARRTGQIEVVMFLEDLQKWQIPT